MLLQQVAQHARLLVDLLQHEGLEARLLRRLGVQGDLLGLGLHLAAIQPGDAYPGPLQHRDLAVVQVDDPGDPVQDGWHVAGDVVLVLPQAHDQRAALAGRENGVRMIRAQDAQRIGPPGLPQGAPQRLLQG